MSLLNIPTDVKNLETPDAFFAAYSRIGDSGKRPLRFSPKLASVWPTTSPTAFF